MSALTLSLAPRRLIASAFAPEWCAIAAVLAIDVAWASATGLRIMVGPHDLLVPGIALAVMLALRASTSTRGIMMAEYFALTLGATIVFGVLSYLCMAHDAPLADGALERADTALGFDWLGGFHVVMRNATLATLLRFCYNSLIYQGLYFGLLLGLLGRKDSLREMFWIVCVAGVFTSAGAFFWPALGPFKTFGLESHGDFLPAMMRLRSGHDLSFALSDMTGVVSFPSFHTTMALAYVYGFRRTGAIGVVVAILNAAMLCAIPFFGGHYLTDMIAGACVMLASLGLVKAYPILRRALRADETAA